MTPWYLLCAAVALLAVACSSDASDNGATDGGTQAATSSAAPAGTPSGASATPSVGNAPGIPPLAGPVLQGANGLQYIDELPGTGAAVQPGQRVTVHYTGWLTTGRKFDSSRDRGQSFAFTVGAREVIAGWDQGVAAMNVGGKRRLILPPGLAYGAAGRPPVIPANATLIFDVEVLAAQ